MWWILQLYVFTMGRITYPSILPPLATPREAKVPCDAPYAVGASILTPHLTSHEHWGGGRVREMEHRWGRSRLVSLICYFIIHPFWWLVHIRTGVLNPTRNFKWPVMPAPLPQWGLHTSTFFLSIFKIKMKKLCCRSTGRGYPELT